MVTMKGLAGCLMLLTASPSVAADDRPNIIVIVCDDMGFSDLGCYGSEIETPHLDRLAAGGVRFTDFHNNAKCSETRASLLTGLWHQQSRNLKQTNQITLAEVLRSAGYSTMMSGKWHVASTPTERGFDRYFGFLSGCINYFTGEDWGTGDRWGSGENLMRLDRDEYHVPENFYSTDAFTDFAIEFLEEAVRKDQPFFLYLAHNAPHFPLHALPEDIAKYKELYRAGWDVLRKQRFDRLQQLEIIDHTWRLSMRDPQVESWSDLTSREIEFLAPMMAVYAAMVDRLDQNIGRLTAYLTSHGELENTLLFFFSDNGACPYQRIRGDHLVPGSPDSEIAYDARWANMCNTPLRQYKQYAHQGGTLTPMIAHWPQGIRKPGSLTHFTSHIVDIMPTVIEVSGARYPKAFNGHDVLPMEGVSLVSALRGHAETRDQPLFWEFSGNHAVREGGWKLVAEKSQDWELYDLSVDHTETKNVVMQHPHVVRHLAGLYDSWAERTGARSHAQCRKMEPSSQSQLFDLKAILSQPAGEALNHTGDGSGESGPE